MHSKFAPKLPPAFAALLETLPERSARWARKTGDGLWL